MDCLLELPPSFIPDLVTRDHQSHSHVALTLPESSLPSPTAQPSSIKMSQHYRSLRPQLPLDAQNPLDALISGDSRHNKPRLKWPTSYHFDSPQNSPQSGSGSVVDPRKRRQSSSSSPEVRDGKFKKMLEWELTVPIAPQNLCDSTARHFELKGNPDLEEVKKRVLEWVSQGSLHDPTTTAAQIPLLQHQRQSQSPQQPCGHLDFGGSRSLPQRHSHSHVALTFPESSLPSPDAQPSSIQTPPPQHQPQPQPLQTEGHDDRSQVILIRSLSVPTML
ncbi:hypothetical protein BT69DRAFT_990079 [Atractiella rhizophila]|nr:hypothetical protein BT69DRAFT_990079 [Atractiella rhizophila]